MSTGGFSEQTLSLIAEEEVRFERENVPEYLRLEWDKRMFGTCYVDNDGRIPPLEIHLSMENAKLVRKLQEEKRTAQRGVLHA